jgi:hypothetical protein
MDAHTIRRYLPAVSDRSHGDPSADLCSYIRIARHRACLCCEVANIRDTAQDEHTQFCDASLPFPFLLCATRGIS